MNENEAKTNTNEGNVVKFITENQVRELVGEANASLMLNPTVVWAKFILTDDLPNGNNQRVPTDEFDNLIISGLHMPVKMAEGKIEEGHKSSKPLGVITHLKKDKDPITNANIIVALAALWASERPSDVAYVRELMEANEEVNVSWELGYRDSRIAEGGVEDLIDTVLKAVTLVTRPAYQGRTRFISMAAKAEKWSKAYIDMLPDSSFLVIEDGGTLDSTGRTVPRSLRHFPVKDDKGEIDPRNLDTIAGQIEESTLQASLLSTAKNTLLDFRNTVVVREERITEEYKLKTIEEFQEEVKALQDKLDAALREIESKDQENQALKSSSAELEAEKKALEEELKPLQEFKSGVEQEKELSEKFAKIKSKFLDSGVEKDEDYFETNKDFLLGLDESALDFMLQELAAFPKLEEGQGEAGLRKPRVPRIESKGQGEVSVSDLAKALKERKAK